MGLAIPIDTVRSVSIGSSKPAICVAVISVSASNSQPLRLATRTRLAVVSGWPGTLVMIGAPPTEIHE
jgi:hypothetical protein